MKYIETKARLSHCENYRYMLTRKWAHGGNPCIWVMLNPSTADASIDDPTIRRIVGFSQGWGYTEAIVVNLFALRATSPIDMLAASDPVGEHNADWIDWALDQGHYSHLDGTPNGRVVVAWGNHGKHMDQDEWFMGRADKWVDRPVYCLGLTKSGQPVHPLYQPSDAIPINYEGRPA